MSTTNQDRVNGLNNESIKDIYLDEELRTSIRLIELGFGELQNLDMANDFHFLPFQLLSSGFERLMKCHICLGHFEAHSAYPKTKELKSYGHNLTVLKNSILASFFSVHDIPALQEDMELLKQNNELDQLISLLSDFGVNARYHNLDLITENKKPSQDVKRRWEEFESDLLNSHPHLLDKLGNTETAPEVLGFITRAIIIKLERFTRALCRQFTMGKLGKKALQYSSTLHQFILLEDSKLGKRDYRKETTNFQAKENRVHSRTILDELQRRTNPNYKHAVITKEDFAGEWPFYHEEVIIECREKHWCVITIDNKDYALNGSAHGRYKLEFPREAGMSIPGISINPFIDMALKLKKN